MAKSGKEKNSEKPKRELVFFQDKKGILKYNKKCVRCTQKCKQSDRSVVVSCKNYDRR